MKNLHEIIDSLIELSSTEEAKPLRQDLDIIIEDLVYLELGKKGFLITGCNTAYPTTFNACLRVQTFKGRRPMVSPSASTNAPTSLSTSNTRPGK